MILEKKLAERLAQVEGKPIIYQGKNVILSHEIAIAKDQEIEIEILQNNTKYKQGFAISVDKRKGFIEVNGQKLNAPVFWANTAPKKFSFKCFPQKQEGIMNGWNIWNNPQYPESVDAWIGNAGIYVEQPNNENFILNCSSGIGEVDFNDLTINILLK